MTLEAIESSKKVVDTANFLFSPQVLALYDYALTSGGGRTSAAVKILYQYVLSSMAQDTPPHRLLAALSDQPTQADDPLVGQSSCIMCTTRRMAETG